MTDASHTYGADLTQLGPPCMMRGGICLNSIDAAGVLVVPVDEGGLVLGSEVYCSITLEQLQPGQVAGITRCKHRFLYSALHDAMSRSGARCPTCRETLRDVYGSNAAQTEWLSLPASEQVLLPVRPVPAPTRSDCRSIRRLQPGSRRDRTSLRHRQGLLVAQGRIQDTSRQEGLRHAVYAIAVQGRVNG